MTRYFIDDVIEAVERWGPVVRVVITRTQGSTPRDAGTSMIVAKDEFLGTIGGGKLEFQALDEARLMLAEGGKTKVKTATYVLATELRQCCGGVAWLLLEYIEPDHLVNFRAMRQNLQPDSFMLRSLQQDGPMVPAPAFGDGFWAPSFVEKALRELQADTAGPSVRLVTNDEGTESWFIEAAALEQAPVYIYGAGHVARALVRILEDMPFDIHWVDIREDRFPSNIRFGVRKIVADQHSDLAATVQDEKAFHVVVTHSHEADLDICRTVLLHAKGQYLGLIASQSKKAKFLNRLVKDGVSAEALNMFKCPIGLISYKHKDPAIVALSIAAELVAQFEQGESETMSAEVEDAYVQ